MPLIPTSNLHMSLTVVLSQTEGSGSHSPSRITQKPPQTNMFVVFISPKDKNTVP